MTTITPDLLAGLRFVASGKTAGPVEVTPDLMLALLDRIEALEKVVGMFMEDPRAFTPRAVAAAEALGFTEGRQDG